MGSRRRGYIPRHRGVSRRTGAGRQALEPETSRATSKGVRRKRRPNRSSALLSHGSRRRPPPPSPHHPPFRSHQLTSPSPRYPSSPPPTPPSMFCAAVARPKAGPVATDGVRAQCQGTESFSHGLANAYPLGANHGARDETNSTRPMLHRCVRHAPLPQARFFRAAPW